MVVSNGPSRLKVVITTDWVHLRALRSLLKGNSVPVPGADRARAADVHRPLGGVR
jgi:hypothetical protein